MSSVAKSTILNLIGGHWIPYQCSVCHQTGGAIKFGWATDPTYCWMCAESAPPDVQQRLDRVYAARTILGFEGSTREDSLLAKALWPGWGWSSLPHHERMPAVIGYPLRSPALLEGQIAERYYVHGLSQLSPEELHASTEITQTSPRYTPYPAPPQMVDDYRWWDRHLGSRQGAVFEDDDEDPPLRSLVFVEVGGAVMWEARPNARYLWAWRLEAPWSGYRETPDDTGLLKREEQESLIKVGRKLAGIEHRGRPTGSGRFETEKDLEQATFAAVAALYKQKRAITQKTVGSHIIAKRGRNRTEREMAGDSHGAPDRQFREWCERFEFDSDELIQRAVAACANGE